jgi:hypothetical protein
MRRVSKADLKENDGKYDGCIFLEPREWLDNAIVGKCASTGGIIYDYDTVVEAFMVKDGLSYDQSVMMVDYNTERALPYMPDPKPILQRNEIAIEEEEDEDED